MQSRLPVSRAAPALVLGGVLGLAATPFLARELVVVESLNATSDEDEVQLEGYELSADDGGRIVVLDGDRQRIAMVPVDRVKHRQLCVDGLPWCAESVSLWLRPVPTDATFPC
jgi:hypothetical protein